MRIAEVARALGMALMRNDNKPKIGKDFPVISVKEKTKYLKECTRSAIAMTVVGAVMLALLGATAIGAWRGDFGVLQTLWSIAGLPLGWIIGHYFRGAGRNDDEDYTSTTGTA